MGVPTTGASQSVTLAADSIESGAHWVRSWCRRPVGPKLRLSLMHSLCSPCLLRNCRASPYRVRPSSVWQRKRVGFAALLAESLWLSGAGQTCRGYAAGEAKPQTRNKQPESQRLSARRTAKPLTSISVSSLLILSATSRGALR